MTNPLDRFEDELRSLRPLGPSPMARARLARRLGGRRGWLMVAAVAAGVAVGALALRPRADRHGGRPNIEGPPMAQVTPRPADPEPEPLPTAWRLLCDAGRSPGDPIARRPPRAARSTRPTEEPLLAFGRRNRAGLVPRESEVFP